MRALLVALITLLLAAPAAAKPTKLKRGTTTINFDNAFGLKLYQLGVSATPIAPATQDSIRFDLPVAPGGRVSESGHYAQVKHSGGFGMKDAAEGTTLNLTELVATVKRKRVSLAGFATIRSTETDVLGFAVGHAKTTKRTRNGFVARGIRFELNGVGAAAMNSQFRTQVFKAGDFMATGTIRARR